MFNSCPEENPPSEGSQTCIGVLPCKCGKTVEKRKQPPNIQHELNTAKAVLQETSTFSGDNMFDHLSEIIKRVLDERPPNVVDYFEEFSRNIREQKFRQVDNFMEALFDEPRCLSRALAIMNSLNLLPQPAEDFEFEMEEALSDVTTVKINRPLMLPENVLLLQYYWSLCGFGFHNAEVFLLSYQMQKIQQHPAVESARFWGKMFGLEKCYFISEVILVESEINKRKQQMKNEMQIRFTEQLGEEENESFIFNPDLIPGTRWQDWPADELKKMKIKQPPVPVPEKKPKYDIPPEPVGSGTNRTTYFVCNTLTEDWMELPIVTPKQIVVSRQIMKYLTGNLDAEIDSYPHFPGKEKHYLRAMISRITASTYISPAGYYKVKKKSSGEENEEEEEEEEEEELGEDKNMPASDAVLVTNKNYKPLPVNELLKGENWIHVRPAILNQGRIVWFDEEKALRALEAKDHEGEEEEDEEEEEEEDEETARTKPQPEVGPYLLTPITEDTFGKVSHPWTIRISFNHNLSNRVVVVRSTLWQGAFSFAHEYVVDTIYIGWGRKYVERNYSPPHIPPIQEEYPLGPEIMEILDPSAKQEEEWRIAHMKPEKPKDDEEEEEEEEDEEEEEKEDD